MRKSEINWGEVGHFHIWVMKQCFDHEGSVVSGVRSDARNKRVGGKATSKHTWKGGWGMALDLQFRTKAGRDAVYNAAHAHPEYHAFIGKDYSKFRLHVQGWKYGVKPGRRDA